MSATPGPWEAGELEPTAICTKGGYVLYRGVPSFSQEDARMIAAAPTMYAYIEARAAEGYVAAQAILESINAGGGGQP